MSMSTQVAHLGVVARAVDFEVVLAEPHRRAGAVADQRVDERLRDVEVGDRVAELVGLGRLQLDGAFADDAAPGAGRCARAASSLNSRSSSLPWKMR